MTHRAQQIVDAIVAAITSVAPSTYKVYAHRRLSLAEDQSELPAHSVDFGEDVPFEADGAGNMAFIDSLLTINVQHVVAAVEEADLREILLEMRTDAHRAIMADRTLGLGFVADSRYGGATPPEIDVSGETLVGFYNSIFSVHYRMNITDPR